jgi:Zn-dependent protease
MSPFLALAIVLSLVGLVAVPLLVLDGGRAYLAFLHARWGFLLGLALAWTLGGSWALRRGAELFLLRRTGVKLRTDA